MDGKQVPASRGLDDFRELLTGLAMKSYRRVRFDNLQELIYVESHLSNTATKFYGELTQQMIKMGDSPGSDNGTGFFQTLASLKLREFYEKKTGKVVEVEQPKVVA